jgi:hypothetical protein
MGALRRSHTGAASEQRSASVVTIAREAVRRNEAKKLKANRSTTPDDETVAGKRQNKT